MLGHVPTPRISDLEARLLDALARWPEWDASVIPFNRPNVPEALLRHLEEVANSGHHSGDGPMTHRAVDILGEVYPEAAVVFLTPSCTHALELAAVILGVGPNDEVIVPAFTFVSTANAFALRGARIRFADIRADTLCLDTDSIENLLSEHTQVIVPVNYAGVGCDLDAIVAEAASVGASVVEDNAHGLFGRLNERPLGSFGVMSTLSFHETKNVSSGEGGALVINDQDLVLPAEIAREKGTNRSQFFRGLVDKYTWVGLGSTWLASEFTAAALLAGLENAPWTQERRHFIWKTGRGGASGLGLCRKGFGSQSCRPRAPIPHTFSNCSCRLAYPSTVHRPFARQWNPSGVPLHTPGHVPVRDVT